MARAFLNIEWVHCNFPTEPSDEIFLKINGKDLWANETLEREDSAYFPAGWEATASTSDKFHIELWEDDPVWNDKIGWFDVESPTLGTEVRELRDGDVWYEVAYNVFWLSD